MQDIYIYGCGGVGNELADHLSTSSSFNVLGFIDDNPEIRSCMGFECRSLTEILKNENPKEISVIITIGEPFVRRLVSEKIREKGINEVSVILSRHFNPRFSSVGKGTLLHDDSYISTNAQIGESCMINKSVLIGHDCLVGDYTVISPHVTLGGNVRIGNNSFIGTGAVIRNGISIGNNVIIGMGSVVVKDVGDDIVVVGNPAKIIRKNETHKVFKNH